MSANRLDSGLPDSKRCLLHQKLQLLNCCISRKRQTNEKAREIQNEDDSESDDGEDEFYDCFGDESEGFNGKNSKEAPAGKPMGRLAKYGDLKLLETGEALYVPVTQDSVPKTEDQLEADTQVLLRLGADALGSELRAKLLSAYLLSDMEAFKAANPGCVFADFIRWCSSWDWIEDEDGELDEFGQKKGHLSSRMEIADNTWINAWRKARPIPAKWQKRLFNETREAEKVLDYLEKKNASEFVLLLLPVLTASVIRKLLQEAADEEELISSDAKEILSRLVRKAERLGRTPNVAGDSYEELINDISAIETHMVHLKFLKQKFSSLSSSSRSGKGAEEEEEKGMEEERKKVEKEKEKEEEEEKKEEKGAEKEEKKKREEEMKEFIRNLLKNGEAEVPGGPKSEIGRKISYYFAEASKAENLLPKPGTQLTPETWNVMSPFPVSSPHEKELILRLSTVHGPQRLHAIIKKNEWRICGAFTKNIYFSN